MVELFPFWHKQCWCDMHKDVISMTTLIKRQKGRPRLTLKWAHFWNALLSHQKENKGVLCASMTIMATILIDIHTRNLLQKLLQMPVLLLDPELWSNVIQVWHTPLIFSDMPFPNRPLWKYYSIQNAICILASFKPHQHIWSTSQ